MIEAYRLNTTDFLLINPINKLWKIMSSDDYVSQMDDEYVAEVLKQTHKMMPLCDIIRDRVRPYQTIIKYLNTLE